MGNVAQLLVSEAANDAIFALSTLCLFAISAYLNYRTFSDHLSVGKLPGLQICCFRVVAIAPAYALLTWLKLMFLPALVVWKTLQDVCEAYAIYCYWAMLILWCGGQRKVIEELDGHEYQSWSLCPLLGIGNRKYACPFIFFASSRSRFRFWRVAMTQLVAIKLVMNLLNMLLMLAGYKGLGKLHFVNLTSTALAMNAIVETYVALRPRLNHFSAERKFICIKIMVAIALIQPMLINAMETIGAFPDDVLYGYSSRKWSQRLLGTVSLIQMVVFSLLLSYAFSLKHALSTMRSSDENGEHDGGDKPMSVRRSQSSLSEASGGIGLTPTLFQLIKVWDVLISLSIDESFITGGARQS